MPGPFFRDGSRGTEREPSQSHPTIQYPRTQKTCSFHPPPCSLHSRGKASCPQTWGQPQPHDNATPPLSHRPRVHQGWGCPCDSATLTKAAVCQYSGQPSPLGGIPSPSKGGVGKYGWSKRRGNRGVSLSHESGLSLIGIQVWAWGTKTT